MSSKSYDPSKSITASNWPPGLKKPPLRSASSSSSKQVEKKKTEKKPNLEAGSSPWDFTDFIE